MLKQRSQSKGENSKAAQKEVLALSNSEKFINFLKERAKEQATTSIDELEKELGLDKS